MGFKNYVLSSEQAAVLRSEDNRNIIASGPWTQRVTDGVIRVVILVHDSEFLVTHQYIDTYTDTTRFMYAARFHMVDSSGLVEDREYEKAAFKAAWALFSELAYNSSLASF